MAFVDDPGAEKRSVMLRQQALCNGQKTGRSCVHYWAHVEKVESHNPDFIRLGQVFRVCGFHPSLAHEMSEEQLAVRCNQYRPRRLPLWKRPLALLKLVDDPGRYQVEYEVYKPLTPAQVAALQAETTTDDLVAANIEQAEASLRAVGREKVVSVDDALDEGIFR